MARYLGHVNVAEKYLKILSTADPRMMMMTMYFRDLPEPEMVLMKVSRGDV